MVNRHGRWYVAGGDRGRNATRVFRLGRIAGPVKFCGPPGRVTVPAGTDVRELVRDWDSGPAQEHTALLRVRAGGGVGLRRHAVSVRADDSAEGTKGSGPGHHAVRGPGLVRRLRRLVRPGTSSS